MAFQDSLLDLKFMLTASASFQVVNDVPVKDLAGFDAALTDPWGRLLSYQLLEGTNGGVRATIITGLSNFTSHAVPFPFMTSLGVKTWLGECVLGPNATTYKFTPYEFGSWDSDVTAFMQTHYFGTPMKNGKPTGLLCTKNYDNLGYVLGTSNNAFNSFAPASLHQQIPRPASIPL